jgi:hypothetical protein
VNYMIGNEHCDAYCLVSRCRYDQGDCGTLCAPGCGTLMVGDGWCQDACNNPACDYDKGQKPESDCAFWGTPTPTPTPTSTPTPTPASSCAWGGLWDTDWGGITMVPEGNHVTGTYFHDNGRIDGTVDGYTLTGTWSESPSYSPPNDAGDIVITQSIDCQSFTGIWRYGSSGTAKNWSGHRY